MTQPQKRLYADRIYKLSSENAFKVGTHITRIENDGHKVIRMNIGEPDFDIPPFVRDEVKKQLDLGNTHYCDPKGLLSLRKAVAHQINETRGLDVTPEHVCILPGGKPIIGFSQEAYCNPGDEVIYPSPGFAIYENFVIYLDLVPKPIQLSEESNFTFTPEQLAQLITPRTKMIILNFPSNPTGGVATEELMSGIAQVINEKCAPDVRIYSDEIYEHYVFDGHKHVSIASYPGMKERTIISSGFSKSYAWTGGRLGYAVFPTEEEANTCKLMNINYYSCMPPFLQEGARVCLEHPESKSWVEHMTHTFQQRRNVIVKKLNEIDGIHCNMPGGAFYLFPNISGACQNVGAIDAFNSLPADLQKVTSPSTLFQLFLLYRHHTATLDRNAFCKLGSEGQHFLRISCGTALEALEEGAQRMGNAATDRNGFIEFMKTTARQVI